jgi:hypothetical protein
LDNEPVPTFHVIVLVLIPPEVEEKVCILLVLEKFIVLVPDPVDTIVPVLLIERLPDKLTVELIELLPKFIVSVLTERFPATF